MTSTTATTARFDMGRVISRTFGAAGKNLPIFVLLSLLFYAVPQFVLQFMMQWGAGHTAELGGDASAWTLGIVGFLVTLILAYVLQATLVHGTVAFLRGRSASLGESLGTGFGAFLPLIGLSILVTLGEWVGFIALFVPGLMLMVRWSVAVPALVVERNRGVLDSMGRSADLTKGHRWSIFGLFVVVGIAAWLVGVVSLALGTSISAATGLVSDGARTVFGPFHSPIAIGVQAVFSSLIAMLGAVGAASLYYELRSLKEGVAAHDLAAVFD